MPGARIGAAPGGGGRKGPMSTPRGPGQLEWEAAQLHHHHPWWKSSVFFILESVMSIPKAQQGLNWETQVLHPVPPCVILDKSLLSDSGLGQ